MTTARAIESVEAFTAGELSPRIVNQKRLSYRGIAAKRIFNFGVRPEGAAYFRAATTFIAEAADHAVSSRLLPFIFNREQTYAVEAAVAKFRFLRDDALIEDPGSPGNPLEVASPYVVADLPALQTAQENDVLFIAAGGDPGKNVRRLQRMADDDWDVKEFEFIDGPYLTQNTDTAVTLNPSAVSGTITITSTQSDFWKSTDVGRLVSLKHSSTRGYAKITAFQSGTVVDAEVKKDFGAATATSEWRLGVFSDTSGWPATLTFYEKRFFVGGARDTPARYDGSLAGILDEFDPDDTGKGGPISDFASGQQLNPIYWMVGLQDLLIGTLGGVFRTRGETESAPLAPDAASTKKQARRSAEPIPPIETDDGTLYVGLNGKALYELIFDLAVNKYRPLDRSVRARHVTRAGLRRMLYQESPFSRVIGIRADGRLAMMTYLPEEQIFAWHVYEIAGPNGSRGHVEDCAVLPGKESDEIWLLVRRTNAQGLTRRYIERLEPQFEDDDVFNGKFLDAGVQYDGTVTTTDLLYAQNAGEIIMTTEADVFEASQVGRQIRYRELLTPADYGNQAEFADAWGEIITFTSAREVTVRTIVPFPAGQGRLAAGTWGLTATTIEGPGLDALAELSLEFGVTADGLNVGPIKYQNGRITLPRPALKARAGFQYEGELAPIDLDTALRQQMTRVDRTRISEVAVRFLRTLYTEIGPDRERAVPIEMRFDDSLTDLPPPLFSGDYPTEVLGDSDDNGALIILQREPAPCEVLGIYAKPMSSTS